MNQSGDLWKKITDTEVIDEYYPYDNKVKDFIIRILDHTDENYPYDDKVIDFIIRILDHTDENQIYESMHQITDNGTQYICFLIACMFSNQPEIIRRLVDGYQIDVNQTDERGNTGLSLACRQNTNIEIIKYLIDVMRMDVNHMNSNSSTCLIQACAGNTNLGIIKYLIEDQRLNIRHVTEDYETCLTVACWENPNLDVIKYLIEDLGLDLWGMNADANSCLGLACMSNGNLEIIKYLINDQKMNIKHVNNNSDTCLSLACMSNGNLEIIKYLINDQKMNIKHVNNNSDTCLTLACEYTTNPDIIKYLIESQNLDVNHVNDENNTCLILACQGATNLEIVKYLIEHHKMDLNHVNLYGETCFTSACRYDGYSALDVAQYLIESTDAKMSFKQCQFDRWKKIIQRITKNYDRFRDVLNIGYVTYIKSQKIKSQKIKMTNFLKTINPMLLMGTLGEYIFGIYTMNPMNKDFKFDDYMKHVNDLTFNVPVPVPVPVVSHVPESKTLEPMHDDKREVGSIHSIDFTQEPGLLFSHNGIKYYGHREIVYDSILCLKEIKEVADFNELIELSGQAPSYIMNLWICAMYAKQIDLREIKIQSDDIILFLNHVDQYPTDCLSIESLEYDVIQYFDTKIRSNTRIDKHLSYLRELACRYMLKRLYLWIHNKMIIKNDNNDMKSEKY
jgi:ankyrin repeat protein